MTDYSLPTLAAEVAALVAVTMQYVEIARDLAIGMERIAPLSAGVGSMR